MKKILKAVCIILGIIVAVVVVLVIVLVILLIKGASSPAVPLNYTQDTATGGAIEAAYMKTGSFEVAYYEEDTEEGFEKYEVYYPAELETAGQKYPVVVYANGTGVKSSRCKALLEHLASWGFIVIGNEDMDSWSGLSSEKCLNYLITQNDDSESRFYGKVDLERVGMTGHSQGGVAVFNAITEHEHSGIYKAAVALSPTNEELALALEWPYDPAKVKIPVFILAGTEGDFEVQTVIPLDKMQVMYEKVNAPKMMARRTGCEHGDMAYQADGYVTAWFMWLLQDDEEAGRAFTGENPEILINDLYQDQRIDLYEE